MSVRKIRSVWWVDFCWRNTRYRKRSPMNSRGGALDYETLLRSRLARGEPMEQHRIIEPKFGDFAKQWLETYVRNNNRPSTVYARTGIMRKYLIPTFGALALSAIDAVRIEKYKTARLEAGLSPKTINGHVSVLHKALATAAESNLLKSVPPVHWLEEPPLTHRFLSSEECERLLAAATHERWRTMILCALRTGMRIGELAGLDWIDVDLKGKRITVRRNMVRGIIGTTKNNRIRRIPIASDLLVALTRIENRSGLVFTTEGGTPVYTDKGLRWLRHACRSAGIKRIGWHVLRHTFASHLVIRGVPIRSVQVLLGHSTVLMTERYAHLDPASLEDAINVLVPEPSRSGRAADARVAIGSQNVDGLLP